MIVPLLPPPTPRLLGELVAAPGDMTTLVVHCSDGRFGNQCDRFIHGRLRQAMYDRLIVPGGAAWLTERAGQTCESTAARAALELLVEAHRLSRVVLIAHAGCAYYLQKLGVPPERSESRQRADLVAIGRWLRAVRPGLHVSAYFAQRHGARVEFKPVFGGLNDLRETSAGCNRLPPWHGRQERSRLRWPLPLVAGCG